MQEAETRYLVICHEFIILSLASKHSCLVLKYMTKLPSFLLIGDPFKIAMTIRANTFSYNR